MALNAQRTERKRLLSIIEEGRGRKAQKKRKEGKESVKKENEYREEKRGNAKRVWVVNKKKARRSSIRQKKHPHDCRYETSVNENGLECPVLLNNAGWQKN